MNIEGKFKIFLSYCWKDEEVANNIIAYFENNINIEIHRDIIDIKKWCSIKEYMQSINDADYIILLISDFYLKSENCMYEVLEVIRDRNYRNKIFPAIVNPAIYRPINRAYYVKYWENEFNELHNALKDISVQNLGKLNEDLKRCQDISANIAEFLDVISDMNNPDIENLCLCIEDKLQSKGIIGNQVVETKSDLFKMLGIKKDNLVHHPTDLEVNQFIKDSFNKIVKILHELCVQYEQEAQDVQIQSENIDTRTMVFRFYKNGQLVRGIRIFLSDACGKKDSIGISDNISLYGNSGNYWNEMYIAKYENEKLKLSATLSLINKTNSMDAEDVVVNIWERNIQPYIK